MKKRIAVWFGGRSPEHDVSIVTGLQMLQALDPTRYEVFPVYIDPEGNIFTGAALRERSNYLLSAATRQNLTPVTLDLSCRGIGRLLPLQRGLFAPKVQEFDVALLAFHGLYGEDGHIQGALALAGVAYTGPRLLDAASSMSKIVTKRLAREAQVPVLRELLITKAAGLNATQLEKLLSDRNFGFPIIVKPNRLGSSIGVAPAHNAAEAMSILDYIFRLDESALIEPFLTNFVEYNVAVRRDGADYLCSAIEQPKRKEELLSFREKYLAGGSGSKGAPKLGGSKGSLPSEGMLSMTRTINPDLPEGLADAIRGNALKVAQALASSGAPRLDFLYDLDRGSLYFNEINPIPGSFGYFLWEAAPKGLAIDELLNVLIAEALALQATDTSTADIVPAEAHLFPRR